MITITVEKERLLTSLRGYPARLRSSLYRTMQRLTIELQAYVKGSKLSGQVLHVRTGTLRRSINQEVVMDGSSVVGVVGTNVKYGRTHEYGFTGVVTVKEHLRKLRGSAKDALKGKQATGVVRAHQRHVDLPERSFLRSALRDFNDRAVQAIGAAAAKAVSES